MTKRVCLTIGLLLLSSSAAFGQMLKPGDGRIFGAASVGALFSPDRPETTAFSFTIYEEPATVNVARTVKGGLLGEFTAGGRVIGNLGVAGSLWFRSAPSDGAVTASIPDPAFFDRPRSVETTVTDMEHKEVWMAVLGSYSMQLNERMAVYLFAGPTVVNVKHQVADTATVAESGNFATVTIGTKELTKVVFGYTLAADGRYMITKKFGLGGFIRYSGAKANLNDTVRLTLGGLSIGAGVRVAIF
jgi:opacity protein-like surface antigen